MQSHSNTDQMTTTATPDQALQRARHTHMKIRSIFWALLLTLGLAIFCGLFWFGRSMSTGFDTAEVGAEYPPAEFEPWLTEDLQERFGWAALPASSVEHVWANGFQDHTYLFRIRLAPDLFASLRQAILGTHGEDVASDDHDDLSLCPFGFATASPQGPAAMRPTWWEAASLRHFDSVLWQSPSWGYWFCYDTDRQLLFLLAYDT